MLNYHQQVNISCRCFTIKAYQDKVEGLGLSAFEVNNLYYIYITRRFVHMKTATDDEAFSAV